MLMRLHVQISQPNLHRRIAKVISQANCLLFTINPGEDILERLSSENGDVFIVSRTLLPEPITATIGAIRKLPDSPEVIVLIDREDAMEKANLLTAGCMAALYTGLPEDRMLETLLELISRRQERSIERLSHDKKRHYSLNDFVSRSPAMKEFLTVARRVVDVDSSLLVLGETGVGKERLARAIHWESSRANGPFIAVNCAALPETLLESELFGHVQGAFTGAIRSHRGYFELAHRGTLLLDEIGELSAFLQVKLLRVLQDHEIQRVGSERTIEVDVRVIAATNRDLTVDMEEQRFRKDLYYRLGVVTLTLPPLRERREDITSLVETYLQEFRLKLRRNVIGVSPDAMAMLSGYSWPGNVRELINVIERSVLLCEGTEVTIADLPHAVTDSDSSERPRSVLGNNGQMMIPFPNQWLEMPWKDVRDNALAEIEKHYLAAILGQTGGWIQESARRANMNPRSLYDKMKKYGLKKEDFRLRK